MSGVYLANFFKIKYARRFVSILAISLPLVGFYLKAANFEGFATTATTLALFLVIIGAVFSPALVSTTPLHYKQIFASVFVGSLMLAMLKPTPPDHFTYSRWANQTELTNSLRSIVPYLENHQEYPIWVFSKDMALSLNYASDFVFGYDHFDSRQVTDIHRIGIDANTADRKDSFFSVHYSDYRGPIPSHWWRIAQHEISEGNTLNFYRSLSKTDAMSELDMALKKIEYDPSESNLFRLYGAARNAMDLDTMFFAWRQLKSSESHSIPLENLSPVIIDIFNTSPKSVNQQLLHNSDFSFGLDSWESTEGLEFDISTDRQSSTPIVEIAIPERLETDTTFYQIVSLEPNTIYFFSLNICSTIAVNLLEFEDDAIDTAYNSGEIFGTWTKASGIFVTPHWDGEPRLVKINLFEASESGLIMLKDPFLAKIKLGLK